MILLVLSDDRLEGFQDQLRPLTVRQLNRVHIIEVFNRGASAADRLPINKIAALDRDARKILRLWDGGAAFQPTE